MNIGIMTDKPDMEGFIPDMFSEAKYLIIKDADKEEIIAKYSRAELEDIGFARKLIEHDCEAVICGPIEKEPFEIIAVEGCVTRYYGVGLSAKDALKAMMEDKLPLIVDCINGTGCSSSHTACDKKHGETE